MFSKKGGVVRPPRPPLSYAPDIYMYIYSFPERRHNYSTTLPFSHNSFNGVRLSFPRLGSFFQLTSADFKSQGLYSGNHGNRHATGTRTCHHGDSIVPLAAVNRTIFRPQMPLSPRRSLPHIVINTSGNTLCPGLAHVTRVFSLP